MAIPWRWAERRCAPSGRLGTRQAAPSGRPPFPTLVDDTLATFRKLKVLKPDIYVTGHPQMLFAGKIERMKANERPHPLLDTGSAAWAKMLDDAQAAFEKRVAAERAQSSSR